LWASLADIGESYAVTVVGGKRRESVVSPEE